MNVEVEGRAAAEQFHRVHHLDIHRWATWWR